MKSTTIKLPTNHSFGVFFSIVFIAVAGYFLWSSELILSLITTVVGCIFFGITVLKDELLSPLNQLWMKLGMILGAVISPLVLGVIYFLLFTPIAISMRIFGRDELRLKKVKRQTFWKSRDSEELNSESFKNQF